MKYQFDLIKKNRLAIINLIDRFSIEQLNKIPEGFNNNLAWNVAHILVTQQLLCYKFSNLPMAVSDELIETYRKGTAPKKAITASEFEVIKKLFITLAEQFEEDYSNGIFKEYNEYTTSLKVTLKDIESATAFNSFHEGIHLGVILSLRKLV